MMDDHDWRQGMLAHAARTEVVRGRGLIHHPAVYFWCCRQCRVLIKASESAGMPGTIFLVVEGDSRLTCAETTLLREVHNS